MAIQVGGTTVIDNSRNLSNVGGLKTVNGTSILGSGNIEAGASTTNNAVGTYAFLLYGWGSSSSQTFGSTKAPTYMQPVSLGVTSYSAAYVPGTWGGGLSGTWRCMGFIPPGHSNSPVTVWVRIS